MSERARKRRGERIKECEPNRIQNIIMESLFYRLCVEPWVNISVLRSV